MKMRTNYRFKSCLFYFYLVLSTILFHKSITIVYSATSTQSVEIASAPTSNNYPNRIVSLAPSITEVLFHLNLGNRVVGVTNYCNYPEEAKKCPKIGGFIDPNIELIILQNPDIVFALPDHKDIIKKLQELKYNVIAVPQYNIEDILNSILVIGKHCGVKEEASKARSRLLEELQKIKELTSNLTKPKVAVSIGREISNEILEQAFLVSSKGFLNEIIEIAGGQNAVNDTTMTYPLFTREGIISINPDIIIDIIPDLKEQKLSLENVIKAWKNIGEVNAIKNNKVFILESDFGAIPGPRFINTIKEFIKIIHPEISK